MGKFSIRKSVRSTIQSDDAGLTLKVIKGKRTERTEHLAWESVADVFAYKKDCYTVDQMRLMIGSEAIQQWIEVTEDDEGYEVFIDQLPSRLAGFPSREEWFQKVALPPFETQLTRLYSRGSADKMTVKGE